MKLYLGNLPFAASDDDIKEAFSAYGTIEDLFIPLDRETNRPRGFAFITLADDDLARIANLTPAQRRILGQLSEGLLNKQIAYELGISEATIKAHVSAVLLKLGVDSRTQAVIRLSRLGIDLESGLAG